MKEYWDEIEGIGTLYTENELIVGIEASLFVCTNGKDRFLIMPYDSADSDYVFCKITDNTFDQMLNNEITMEQAFRKAEYIGETFYDGDVYLRFNRYDSKTFSCQKLPNKGVYYSK